MTTHGISFDVTFKLLSFAVSCLIGVLVWSMNDAISHVTALQSDVEMLQIDVASIKSNRYTPKHALENSQRFHQQLSDFRLWIESHYPPKYLVQAVESNNARIDGMQRDVDQRLDLIREEMQLIRQEMAKMH